jgi:uncharacterized protein YceK
MIRRFKRLAVILACSFALSGCIGVGTYLDVTSAEPGTPRIFGGARHSFRNISEMCVVAPFWIIDTPVSLAWDILILPYTITCAIAGD